jgi:hypothetical protein
MNLLLSFADFMSNIWFTQSIPNFHVVRLSFIFIDLDAGINTIIIYYIRGHFGEIRYIFAAY